MKAARWAMLAAAAAVAAGCATPHKPAPVYDGRAAKQAAPKPLATPAPVAPRSVADYYSVKRGDTLYSIAQEHGVDQRDVMQWNGLDDPTRLRVGQQLRVRPPL
ncbi:MAG TPA: LysM domain-containing protein, partial [Burkholderiales bacterium]